MSMMFFWFCILSCLVVFVLVVHILVHTWRECHRLSYDVMLFHIFMIVVLIAYFYAVYRILEV